MQRTCDSSLITERYAQALFRCAQQHRVLEEVHCNLVRFVDLCQTHPKLVAFLAHPLIHKKDKKKILQRCGKHYHRLTIQFLQLVTRWKRSPFLLAIAQAFLQLYTKSKEMHVAHVITAKPLSEATTQKLIAFIQKISHITHVSIRSEVNPAILGGYILQLEGYRLDASIRTKLDQLLRFWSK